MGYGTGRGRRVHFLEKQVLKDGEGKVFLDSHWRGDTEVGKCLLVCRTDTRS